MCKAHFKYLTRHKQLQHKSNSKNQNFQDYEPIFKNLSEPHYHSKMFCITSWRIQKYEISVMTFTN